MSHGSAPSGRRWTSPRCADNARSLSQFAGEGCAVMAMVKANGYGHGAVDAAAAAVAGAQPGSACPRSSRRWSCVGGHHHAAAQRRLDHARRDEHGSRQRHRHRGVHSVRRRAAAREAARGAPRPLRVHWKIDTGMGRLGTRLEDIETMRHALLEARGGVEVVGMFTHFASADDETTADHGRRAPEVRRRGAMRSLSSSAVRWCTAPTARPRFGCARRTTTSSGPGSRSTATRRRTARGWCRCARRCGCARWSPR